MPAEATAMIMRAETGEELACRAHDKEFGHGGVPLLRGVVSYYAAATLGEATTMRSWLHLVEQTSRQHVSEGTLTLFHQPVLQIAGDGGLPVIGRPGRNRQAMANHMDGQ